MHFQIQHGRRSVVDTSTLRGYSYYAKIANMQKCFGNLWCNLILLLTQRWLVHLPRDSVLYRVYWGCVRYYPSYDIVQTLHGSTRHHCQSSNTIACTLIQPKSAFQETSKTSNFCIKYCS